MRSINKYIYLGLFAVLYVSVALVSTLHAVSFFELANDPILAVILAITFEIGQAAVLFSILTNLDTRKKAMPWILMGILTLVQVLGNIYSSYKYLITNSIDNIRFFREPVFVWTQLPDNQTTVILTYIIGAILPICALALTGMVTTYLGNEKSSCATCNEESEVEDVAEMPKSNNIIKSDKEQTPILQEDPIPIGQPTMKSHFVNI